MWPDARSESDASPAPPAIDFEFITIFPELVEAALGIGITARARRNGLFRVRTWNPRDFTHDAYRRVDDRPYGGGPGMVMLAEPLQRCLDAIHAQRRQDGCPSLPVVHLSPQGQTYTQSLASRIVAERQPGFIFLCGRYEAVDQRFLDRNVDLEWSIGDFVVAGGELPAVLMAEAMVRLLPGVLNHAQSADQDSFSNGLLDCPHYTRPEVLDGESVDAVLLSGDHARIARWRREQALRQTWLKRPDLIVSARRDGRLNDADERYLRGL